MISTNLMEREDKSIEEVLLTMGNYLMSYYLGIRLEHIPKIQDRLNWDCISEDCIPNIFVKHQRMNLAHNTTRMAGKR